MKLRIYCIGVVAFGFAMLAGCTEFIPAGAAAAMNGTPTRVKNINDYPEHLVYRIDDHRFITIKGTESCVGTVYFYDNRIGIRTPVAATGLTLGDGLFRGSFAIDSKFIAIPIIIFSQIRGPLLYVYYSRDNGKTFKRFLSGSEDGIREVFLLKDENLYVARVAGRGVTGYSSGFLYDISQEILLDHEGFAQQPDSHRIIPSQIPTDISSPSGSTKWECGPVLSQ